MGLSEFLLENAFFLQRLEARGGDRFVNHPHNFTLTWDSVHSRVNSEMQRDREDSLVLGPPTRVWGAWFPLPHHVPDPSYASSVPLMGGEKRTCPSTHPMPRFLYRASQRLSCSITWWSTGLPSWGQFCSRDHGRPAVGGGVTSSFPSATHRFSAGFTWTVLPGSSAACMEVLPAFLIWWGVISCPATLAAQEQLMSDAVYPTSMVILLLLIIESQNVLGW